MSDWPASAIEVSEAISDLVDRVSNALASQISDGDRAGSLRQDPAQAVAYELAFLAAEAKSLDVIISHASSLAPWLGVRAAALVARSVRSRLDGPLHELGLGLDIDQSTLDEVLAAGNPTPDTGVLMEGFDFGRGVVDSDLQLAARELRRFGEKVIAPRAEEIHRRDLDIPDEIIDGLAELGVFGLSIPEEFGGGQQPGQDHLAMVVATDELSRASLGAGGSLITRPEILARALVTGGTQEQKERWLPGIADGSKLVAVAVTEPDVGSDVAGIELAAVRSAGNYLLTGSKMWSTFAGRADLLMVLARTNLDPASRHRGLSLFVVEKPRFSGHDFSFEFGGGTVVGRAIPTIGYRGMHSFEIRFDQFPVPAENLIGGESGHGQGFFMQVDSFAAGRLQTAARAVGLMQAAMEAASEYARERRVFGKPLIEYELTRARLADMAVQLTANRLFTYRVAGMLASDAGQLEAAMVKALACRAAEAVTRDAMQLFGGYGYAEEYPVSRFYVDARVLSIFEGTEEVLALRVIARQLVEAALNR